MLKIEHTEPIYKEVLMSCGANPPMWRSLDGCKVLTCILEHGHDGEHVVKGDDGKYYAWPSDVDCAECALQKTGECSMYRIVAESEVETMLADTS